MSGNHKIDRAITQLSPRSGQQIEEQSLSTGRAAWPAAAPLGCCQQQDWHPFQRGRGLPRATGQHSSSVLLYATWGRQNRC